MNHDPIIRIETWEHLLDDWSKSTHRSMEDYCSNSVSYLAGVPPEIVLKMPVAEISRILERRYGDAFIAIVSPELNKDVIKPQSPVADKRNSQWLKSTNMVGINIRTVGSFWGVVAYALTLPKAHDAIHLLPIWEPGVVGSLYGISSWNINKEFYSPELAEYYPKLNTVEYQLKIVVEILHLMGKTVGMDVIPHTDRFSEVVLANPGYFEWLVRNGELIVDHHEELHQKAEAEIFDFLIKQGSAVPGVALPDNSEDFFRNQSEAFRCEILFGRKADYNGRLRRRIKLVKHLHGLGLETVPATMAPPYRGLEVDPSPDARKIDENGLEWRDYRITRPEDMSRVFGPLARYKLYGRLKENRDWEIDFNQPQTDVWEYVAGKYAVMQQEYGFDFMRGDMSHVQMRPDGVPENPGSQYDILCFVKESIVNNQCPWFGYYAESFLAPDNVMAYGSEADHLEASKADVVLGDLQSTVVGEKEFMDRLQQTLEYAEMRSFKPCFTIMTADKDDPRFDEFYLHGNELRYFMGLFLPLPSYYGYGFEVRDPHPEPVSNEHYSKLYVFQETIGPKKTNGPYMPGRNAALFFNIQRIREFAEQYGLPDGAKTCRWIRPYRDMLNDRLLYWEIVTDKMTFLCMANMNLELHQPWTEEVIDYLRARFDRVATASLSTYTDDNNYLETYFEEYGIFIRPIQRGEGIVFGWPNKKTE